MIVRRAVLGSQLREGGVHGFGVPVDHNPENPSLWLRAGLAHGFNAAFEAPNTIEGHGYSLSSDRGCGVRQVAP